MATDHRAELARIHRFDQLIRYLRDEMGWPIASDNFEDLTFDYTAEELGINAESAAKIQEIKRLRPLSAQQPWGIFFVKFEPKNLPVVALRRILSQVALKKRASANVADRAGWAADDLLFVSNYGQDGERKISFAHFARPTSREDLPTLKVLGWDNQDTPLHLDAIARELTENLAWPEDESDADAWRQRWRSAFTLGHREVITTAERLSIRLAELAGVIRDRIRSAIAVESPRGRLTLLMKAFKEALVQDLDAEGFADMYAQTISYGLLSSRIADPNKKTADDFAAHMRTSPFLRELMQTFIKVGGRQSKSDGTGIDFDELGVSDVIELLDQANMEAVLRDFGDRNRHEDPVIHFFEGFLKAYDRRIRKDRGVFYTPQSVVSYIVRSVHELLRNEFGLEDGLADTTTWAEMLTRNPNLKSPLLGNLTPETRAMSPDEPFVQILDPATGTATFIVEVIDVIYRTLKAKWRAQYLTESQQVAKWNTYVPKHLLPRLHGYELMMAPYAIAHMKIGLKLAETGYTFNTEERARVYLTNSLEPWAQQLQLAGFDALAQEAAAVNEIKRYKHFTVVLGNPPYSGESKNKGSHILLLMDEYKKEPNGSVLNEKNSKWINDDYVKFIRLSHKYIMQTGFGIVSFITNHSWLDNPTFRGMRASLMKDFDEIHVIDLHGNAKKKESTPKTLINQGQDKNVFDIAQGVAILSLQRGIQSQSATSKDKKSQANEQAKKQESQKACISHADVWGSREYKYSWLNHNDLPSTGFKQVFPALPHLLFIPRNESLAQGYEQWWKVTDVMPFNSVGIVTARDSLTIQFTQKELKQTIRNFSSLTAEEAREHFHLGKDSRDWRVEWAQNDLNEVGLSEDFIKSINYRPFDQRKTFYTGTTKGFHCMPRGEVMGSLLSNKTNYFLGICRQVKSGNWSHALIGNGLVESCYISNRTSEISTILPLWGIKNGKTFLNLNPRFLAELSSALNVPSDPAHCGLPQSVTAEDVLAYFYAVLHAPSYRQHYAEFLKSDFPRIPIRTSEKLLFADLWHSLVPPGRALINLHLMQSRFTSKHADFPICGNNTVTRISFELPDGEFFGRVWINSSQYFNHVPLSTWKYVIGAYQICEKWLKDRRGRLLTKDDLLHYQKIVIALSETIKLTGEIETIIEKHGGWPDALSTN